MLEAAWAVLPRTGEPPTLRMILSSRHGEYARTFSLLTEEAETGTVSPADFSLSVHHALVGLLSIVTGNRVGHSAIAAGRESFASALLEAAACLAEGERDVLVLHFDSSLPDAYAEPKEEPVALALLLRPRNSRTGMPLRMERTPEPSSSCAMEATSLAARFVRLLSGEERDLSAAGARAIWRWHRDG